MRATLSLYAGDLTVCRVTGNALDGDRRQIRMGDTLILHAYLTPAEVREVAERWTALADELAGIEP